MNISNAVYLLLLLLIIGLSITISIKNSNIKLLESEKYSLNMQIISAENNIELQNQKIKEMAVNNELAEINYNKKMKELHEKYSKLDNVSSQNKTCNEILNIINENQRGFLNDK